MLELRNQYLNNSVYKNYIEMRESSVPKEYAFSYLLYF